MANKRDWRATVQSESKQKLSCESLPDAASAKDQTPSLLLINQMNFH